jgi:hypothetical protein
MTTDNQLRDARVQAFMQDQSVAFNYLQDNGRKVGCLARPGSLGPTRQATTARGGDMTVQSTASGMTIDPDLRIPDEAWRHARAMTRRQRVSLLRAAGWHRIPQPGTEVWVKDGQRCSLFLAASTTIAEQFGEPPEEEEEMTEPRTDALRQRIAEGLALSNEDRAAFLVASGWRHLRGNVWERRRDLFAAPFDQAVQLAILAEAR